MTTRYVVDTHALVWFLEENPRLGATEMHDRQIVATALLLIDQGETVSLLTRDANIRESKLIPVIW